jgi:hypothetical protein
MILLLAIDNCQSSKTKQTRYLVLGLALVLWKGFAVGLVVGNEDGVIGLPVKGESVEGTVVLGENEGETVGFMLGENEGETVGLAEGSKVGAGKYFKIAKLRSRYQVK